MFLTFHSRCLESDFGLFKVIFKRGTTVPIRLTLSSSDVDALDLIAQPDVPIAELTFRLQPLPGVQSAGSALSWRKLQEIPRVVWSNKKELEYEDEDDVSRTLEGQIDIPVNTQASFSFGALVVYVSTVVRLWFVARAHALFLSIRSISSLRRQRASIPFLRISSSTFLFPSCNKLRGYTICLCTFFWYSFHIY